MHSTIKFSVLIITLGLVFSPLSAQELTAMPIKTDVNGTAYLSGGVGDQELLQINQASKDYNLKLILAEKSGAYAANVPVSIFDHKGKQVLNVPSSGPILLTNLAPDKYRVRASYQGLEKQQEVRVIAGSQKTLTFAW